MRSHFQIVTTDAEQPYLVRFFSGNGEEILRSSENYADVADAERAVCITAEAFYTGRALLGQVDEHGQQRIRITPHPHAAALITLSVPVVRIDERKA